jgi:hypothetical protein
MSDEKTLNYELNKANGTENAFYHISNEGNANLDKIDALIKTQEITLKNHMDSSEVQYIEIENAEVIRISDENSRKSNETIRVNTHNQQLIDVNTIKDEYDLSLHENTDIEIVNARKGEVNLGSKIDKIVPQLTDIATDVKSFWQVGETDWALAINRAIQYIIDNKQTHGKLNFPQGVINVYTNIINISTAMSIEGKGAFKDPEQPGSYINDLRPSDLTTPLFNFRNIGGTSQVAPIIKGITISGNERNSDCIYALKCGWDAYFENVIIENYKGSALAFDFMNDSNYINVSIFNCGSDGNSVSPRYAIEMINTCNELHFFGLHMEHCRFFMNIESAYLVDFEGCKWEQSGSKLGTNLTHPLINLGDCQEITFGSGCSFIPIGVKAYLYANPNMDYTKIPYVIGGSTTLSNSLDRECVKFIGCTSTTGAGSSGGVVTFGNDYSLLINLPNKRVQIIGCTFNKLAGLLESIRVGDNSIIDGNVINIKDHPASINTDIINATQLDGFAKGVYSTNSMIANNIIWHMSGGGIMRDDWAVNGIGNIYTNNKFIGFVIRYKDRTAGSANSINDYRIISIAPPTTGKNYQREIIYNSNPQPSSYVGWVCTTTGTACTTAFAYNTTYTVGQYVKNAGKVFICTIGGTTQVSGVCIPPQHSNGTVSDGVCSWLFIDTQSTFKGFGLIEA